VLLSSNIILLLVSAVTCRREIFNIRVAIIILLGTIAFIIYMLKDTGIYNSLFHTAVITHSLDLFTNIIGIIILLFSPESCGNLTDLYLSVVTPIVVYSNADLQKSEILKENKGKCGVYR